MKSFRSVSVPVSDHAVLADQLNTLSAEGWTVLTIVSTAGDVVAFLERESATSASNSTATTNRGEPVAESGGWASATSVTPTAVSPSPVAASPTVSPNVTPTQVMPTVEPVVQQPVQQPVHQPAQPAQSAAPSTPAVPADWYKDPSGRFEMRYWNGTKWTEHVARGGKQFVDPPVP